MPTPLVTTALNGTITQGKTRQLFNFVDATAGSKGIVFTNEADAVKLSFNIVEMTGKVYFNVYEISGDSADHETLIFQSRSIGDLGVVQESLLVTGKIRVEVFYTGTITAEFSAIGISAMATGQIHSVKVIDSTETLMYQDEVKRQLHNIEEKMEVLTNHLRFITGLEIDKGEKF